MNIINEVAAARAVLPNFDALRDQGAPVVDLVRAYVTARNASSTLRDALADPRVWGMGRAQLDGVASRLELVRNAHAGVSVDQLKLAKSGLERLAPSIAAIRHVDVGAGAPEAARATVEEAQLGLRTVRTSIRNHLAIQGITIPDGI